MYYVREAKYNIIENLYKNLYFTTCCVMGVMDNNSLEMNHDHVIISNFNLSVPTK